MYVLNVVDGCIPSDMATGSRREIEEERRLLYVAMTRAKDHLHLMVPQRFFVHAAADERRPARLRGAHPLHPGRAARMLRVPRMAARDGDGRFGKSCAHTGRHQGPRAPDLGMMDWAD